MTIAEYLFRIPLGGSLQSDVVMTRLEVGDGLLELGDGLLEDFIFLLQSFHLHTYKTVAMLNNIL